MKEEEKKEEFKIDKLLEEAKLTDEE